MTDAHVVHCMSGASETPRPCFICGHSIAPADFAQWPDSGKSRYAICAHCGAPNEQHDSVFLVLDESHPYEAPPTFSDVYALVGGGWRACCDCGLTEAVDSQASGWSWILDHKCSAAQ